MIPCLVAILAVLVIAVIAIWHAEHTYRGMIQNLVQDNKDLRDRLFQSRGLPPSGVNVTEAYIEKKGEQRREFGQRKTKGHRGPLEKLTASFTKQDLADKEQGLDVT